ncbi:MAG: lactate utilization protein [Thermoflexales bacterium]
MSARDAILNRLRKTVANGPPVALPTAAPRVPVTRIDDASGPALRARFAAELERVRGRLHPAANEAEARSALAAILRGCAAKRIAAWDDVPLTGWADTCAALGVSRVGDDRAEAATADIGLTGCDAVIAATGTLALEGGPGRSRLASLLPAVHVVIARERQLVPRLEDYLDQKRVEGNAVYRRGSALTLVTGPSRTADIEMQIVYGAHGPLELHVILIAE